MEGNGLEAFSENNLWSETDEKWNYNETPVDISDWRVVGSRVYKPRNNIEKKEMLRTRGIGGLRTLECNISEKENKVDTLENFQDNLGDIGGSIIHDVDFIDAKSIHYNVEQAELKCARKPAIVNAKEIKKYIGKHTSFEPSQLIGYNLFIIEFESKRLDIGFTTEKVFPGTYVILEADRGEDCGKIKFQTTLERYTGLLETYSLNDEIVPKRILRIATNEDLKVLVKKKELESEALRYCVTRNYLDMEIVSCEYQWDMKKLTFFFVSNDRVDFRELVKDLYKTYKTRIWMCCVEKSKNWCLKTLMYEYT